VTAKALNYGLAVPYPPGGHCGCARYAGPGPAPHVRTG
jgi:hypothetical protein